jgi:hypothetical protein
VLARRIDPKVVEGMRQFHAAAADVGMIGRRDVDPRIRGNGRPGLRDRPIVYRHLPGHDQGARPLARGSQPTLDQRDVQADLPCPHRG